MVRWSGMCVSWILYLYTTHKTHMICCAGSMFLFSVLPLFLLNSSNCYQTELLVVHCERSTHIVSSFNECTCMMHIIHTHDSHNCRLKWNASVGKMYVLYFMLCRVRVNQEACSVWHTVYAHRCNKRWFLRFVLAVYVRCLCTKQVCVALQSDEMKLNSVLLFMVSLPACQHGFW